MTDSIVVESMPLVTRNFTQIIGLSTGVSSDVMNAGELGRGGGSNGSDAFVAAGGANNDNNFQMNGVEVNDFQQSGYFSGGVAVPNPDTIQEFKVQTGQYDASYGRDAGANVNVVTKTGSNQFHGTMFEFFRNDALNANEWFRNRNGEPRQVLRQNQYGMTFGGPIIKNKLLFFTSYQGTRQTNGVDPTCSTTFSTPPLDGRSLGRRSWGIVLRAAYFYPGDHRVASRTFRGPGRLQYQHTGAGSDADEAAQRAVSVPDSPTD